MQTQDAVPSPEVALSAEQPVHPKKQKLIDQMTALGATAAEQEIAFQLMETIIDKEGPYTRPIIREINKLAKDAPVFAWEHRASTCKELVEKMANQGLIGEGKLVEVVSRFAELNKSLSELEHLIQKRIAGGLYRGEIAPDADLKAAEEAAYRQHIEEAEARTAAATAVRKQQEQDRVTPVTAEAVLEILGKGVITHPGDQEVVLTIAESVADLKMIKASGITDNTAHLTALWRHLNKGIVSTRSALRTGTYKEILTPEVLAKYGAIAEETPTTPTDQQ